MDQIYLEVIEIVNTLNGLKSLGEKISKHINHFATKILINIYLI